jgi:tetratricopeptide (TPR) repeat protein
MSIVSNFLALLILLATLIPFRASSAQTPDVSISAPAKPSDEFKQHFESALKLCKDQEYAAAAEEMKHALELDPDSVDAHRELGKMLVDKNDYEGAAAQFNRVLDLMPKDAETWASLGSCYQTLNKLPEAITCYRRALELDQYISTNKIVRGTLPVLEQSLNTPGLGTTPCTSGQNDYLGDATRFRIARWDTGRIPIKVCLIESGNVPGYKPAFVDCIKRAFSAWEEASGKKIQFSYVNEPSAANIVCSWTNDPTHVIPASEGGQALLSADNEGLHKVDLTLATTGSAGLSVNSFADAQTERNYLHLVGHALGLIGHSENPNDIMASYDGVSEVKTDLSPRDKNTLLALYSLGAETIAQYPLDPSLPPITGNAPCKAVHCEQTKYKGSEHMEHEQYAEAIPVLENALRHCPDNFGIAKELVCAYTAMANKAVQAGSPPDAEQYFKKAETCAEPLSKGDFLAEFANSKLKESLKNCLEQHLKFLDAQNRKSEARIVASQLRSLEQ